MCKLVTCSSDPSLLYILVNKPLRLEVERVVARQRDFRRSAVLFNGLEFENKQETTKLMGKLRRKTIIE
jgi:hypothetical protein